MMWPLSLVASARAAPMAAGCYSRSGSQCAGNRFASGGNWPSLARYAPPAILRLACGEHGHGHAAQSARSHRTMRASNAFSVTQAVYQLVADDAPALGRGVDAIGGQSFR